MILKISYPNQNCWIRMIDYAISTTMEVKNVEKVSNFLNLDFKDKTFDFIMALGVIYTHTLNDAIKCLKEIERGAKQFYYFGIIFN